MNEKLLSIQEVSLGLNIPKHTLRFWEKEFQGILVQIRTDGGQRRYKIEHLAILGQIKLLKEEGKSLLEIRERLQRDSESKIDRPGVETIDILSKRIAEVLRDEIFTYLKKNESYLNKQESIE